MLDVQQAIEKLLEKSQPIAQQRQHCVENISVYSSLGSILAKDIIATIDVPPADNSAMDGYAFCYADAVKNNFLLPISQRIPAGAPPQALQSNTAARIFTGGEIPQDADTVAMQEDCSESNGCVSINTGISAGANVRQQGQDIKAGHIILTAGTLIRAQEMGLLASLGLSKVEVYQPLKVGIFSTGDELVEPGIPLKSGQIYNSNRATLIGLLQSLGMQVVDLGTVPDCLEATKDILHKATETEKADVVLSAGGVSVGEEDYVKEAVTRLGTLDFWKVAIKPGKPLAFGTVNKTPFIGLPGNPASVFVTFMVLIRPFLQACQGAHRQAPKYLISKACFSKSGEKREVYLRGRLTDKGVEIYPNQSSGVLSSACWGDVFVVQKTGQAIEKGDDINVLPYSLS